MRSVNERFWAKVDKTDPNGCWLWTAALILDYGTFRVNSKSYLAHRFVWILVHRSIPKNRVVRQRCGNRRCVNIDHLYLSTWEEIYDDKVKKGTYRSPFINASLEDRKQWEASAKEMVDLLGTRHIITPEDRKKGHVTRGCNTTGVPRERGRFDLDPTWKRVLKHDPCVYCGAQSTEIDHILSYSRGGEHDWTNRAPSCLRCNRTKNDLPLLKFLVRKQQERVAAH